MASVANAGGLAAGGALSGDSLRTRAGQRDHSRDENDQRFGKEVYELFFDQRKNRPTTLYRCAIKAAVDANRPCDTTVLASSSYHEPSLVFLVGTKTVLTDVDGVAKYLAADPACALGLAPIKDEQKLNELLAGQGKSAKRLTEIDGLNYSSGDKLALGLYRVTP